MLSAKSNLCLGDVTHVADSSKFMGVACELQHASRRPERVLRLEDHRLNLAVFLDRVFDGLFVECNSIHLSINSGSGNINLDACAHLSLVTVSITNPFCSLRLAFDRHRLTNGARRIDFCIFNGRNETNIRAVRDIDSRDTWEDIKNVARIITLKWSKSTKLGAAAHYILRHYEKLTAYLNNPVISISNDFSERMLRMEKLIQANALFRNSIEGRFALDINRSSLQTAIAAQVPLQEYVNYVLRASPADVAANPAAYTALAYSRNNQNPSN